MVEEEKISSYKDEGQSTPWDSLKEVKFNAFNAVEKKRPFDDAIIEYLQSRDSGEPVEPFELSREDIEKRYYKQYPLREDYSGFDKIFKTEKYKKYLKNVDFANRNIDGFYNKVKGDETAIIPKKLANVMKSIMNNPDYILATHISSTVDGKKYEEDGVLKSIMEEGLINMGDASSGHVYNDPPLHRTTTFCFDDIDMVSRLNAKYKGSTGAVILAFPSEYVEKNGIIKKGMEDKIYNHNELGNSIIKPEYIVGFVQNLGPGTVCQFKTREELLRGYEKES